MRYYRFGYSSICNRFNNRLRTSQKPSPRIITPIVTPMIIAFIMHKAIYNKIYKIIEPLYHNCHLISFISFLINFMLFSSPFLLFTPSPPLVSVFHVAKRYLTEHRMLSLFSAPYRLSFYSAACHIQSCYNK